MPLVADADLPALVLAERQGWARLMALIDALPPDLLVRPGYYQEGWSAKDLCAHLAGWLAEAGLVLEQVRAGTFTGRDLEVQERNQRFLEADRDQPVPVVLAQANASRHRMLGEVRQLQGVSPEAARWLDKAGPDHYAEHLPRLEEWVRELTGQDFPG